MHSVFLPQSPNGARSIAPQKGVVITPPTPSKRRVEAIPFDKFPLWARAIAKFGKMRNDTGLGDTVVHMIGDTRSERFKKWFQRKFGQSCGCTERQKWLNQRFPYPDFIALQNQPGNVKTMTQKK